MIRFVLAVHTYLHNQLYTSHESVDLFFHKRWDRVENLPMTETSAKQWKQWRVRFF